MGKTFFILINALGALQIMSPKTDALETKNMGRYAKI